MFIPGVGGIIVYWFECFMCSKAIGYLRNIMDEEELTEYIQLLKCAKPVCTFTIQCHHEENNGQGGSHRVNTHFAKTHYPILHHTDETSLPSQMLPSDCNDKTVIILCKFPLDFHPGDEETAVDYPVFRERFYQENTGDKQQDKKEFFEVEGARYSKHGTIVLTSGNTGKESALPFYMKVQWFVLASLLFLSVPYRKYMYSHTRKMTWSITKHFSKLSDWTAEPMNSLRPSTDTSLAAPLPPCIPMTCQDASSLEGYSCDLGCN